MADRTFATLRRGGKNRGRRIFQHTKLQTAKTKTPNEIQANSIKNKMISVFGVSPEDAEQYRVIVINFNMLTTMNVLIWAGVLSMIARYSPRTKTLSDAYFVPEVLDEYVEKAIKITGATKQSKAIEKNKAYISFFAYYRFWVNHMRM